MKQIRKLELEDKAEYLEMMQEFHSSDVVLHKIPVTNMERSFEISVSDSPLSQCFIFEYKKKAAGYGLLSFSYSNECGGTIIWIEELYIRESYRNQGFGKAFFQFIESTYKDSAKRIRLEVEGNNKRAINFYKRIGYDIIEYMQMYKDFI